MTKTNENHIFEEWLRSTTTYSFDGFSYIFGKNGDKKEVHIIYSETDKEWIIQLYIIQERIGHKSDKIVFSTAQQLIEFLGAFDNAENKLFATICEIAHECFVKEFKDIESWVKFTEDGSAIISRKCYNSIKERANTEYFNLDWMQKSNYVYTTQEHLDRNKK